MRYLCCRRKKKFFSIHIGCQRYDEITKICYLTGEKEMSHSDIQAPLL